jgi:uncharacterized LabA/DUF88 family protein
MGMAIDAITMADKLDVVVLGTGDGDFVPLVEYLHSKGCQVEVISFGKSASGHLREVADDFIDMCDNPRNYLIGYRGTGNVRNFIPGLAASANPDEGIDVGTEVYEDTDAADTQE